MLKLLRITATCEKLGLVLVELLPITMAYDCEVGPTIAVVNQRTSHRLGSVFLRYCL